jgi:hypothetical protein
MRGECLPAHRLDMGEHQLVVPAVVRRTRLHPVRDLWIGSLLVYGLLLVEDPAMLAARLRLTEAGFPAWLSDVALATAMLVYNYGASRYVVGVAGSNELATAMERVDRRRAGRVATTGNPVLRALRRVAMALNPVLLVKRAGEVVGRAADRLSRRLHASPLRRSAAWVEDLGMVNLVGVPAASLTVATTRGAVSRGRSARHSVLFVVSWFAGARLVGALVGVTHTVPGAGPVAEQVTSSIGRAFAACTDPGGAVGALTITLAVVAVVRYAHDVQRTLVTSG